MYVNKSFALQGDDYDYDSIAHRDLHDDDPSRTFRLVTFILSIPISLIAVLVDILIIYIIVKFNAFKTRANYFILHFCICNIIFLTSEHILHLAMDLFFGGYLEIKWYCTFIQLENYFLDMCFIFVTGYVLDEYIVMTASEYFQYTYKNGYKYIIGCIYLVHLILAFIVTSVCFSSIRDLRFHSSFIFVTIIYIICLAIVIKIRADCRKTYFKNNKYLTQALSVTIFTILFFLPLVFYYNMLSIVEAILSDEKLEVLRGLAFVAEYMAYGATFILAYKLYKENKFYRLAVCKIFRRGNTELDFSRLDVVPQADIEKK